MPVIKSAIKKLRQDKKSEKANDAFRDMVAKAVKLAKKERTPETISKAFSLADKAAKKNLIHANKAARIKSSLVKSASNKDATHSVKKAPIKSKAIKKAASKVKKTKSTAAKSK